MVKATVASLPCPPKKGEEEGRFLLTTDRQELSSPHVLLQAKSDQTMLIGQAGVVVAVDTVVDRMVVLLGHSLTHASDVGS